MPMRLNPIQRDPEKAKAIHFYLGRMEEENENRLANAFISVNKKLAETRKTDKKKNNAKKKTGRVLVSNTDTVSMCVKLKARLNAKLGEITASQMDSKLKQMMAKDIMTQINKIEIKIAEIKRRDAAIQEEKKENKDETEQAKRSRRKAMEKRTTSIKKDYLYKASEGGLDPDDPLGISITAGAPSVTGIAAESVAVTAEIGGGEVVMSNADISMAAMETAGSFEALL